MCRLRRQPISASLRLRARALASALIGLERRSVCCESHLNTVYLFAPKVDEARNRIIPFLALSLDR